MGWWIERVDWSFPPAMRPHQNAMAWRAARSGGYRTGNRHPSLFTNPEILGPGPHALAAIPKDLVAFSEMKRTRVQSRQDFVRYAAPPPVRPCPSDPDCNWRCFDSWNWVDRFDKRSRPVTPPSDGEFHPALAPSRRRRCLLLPRSTPTQDENSSRGHRHWDPSQFLPRTTC